MDSPSEAPPSDRTSYLIARAPQSSPLDWNRPIITYCPPTNSHPCPTIGVYTGVTAHDPGGECPPQYVFEREGLLTILEQCEASWFLPFIRRMAGGNPVPLEEISLEYRRRFGCDIESKKFVWGGGEFPTVQAAYDRAHTNK